jgi:hypothetical protein
MPGRRSHLCFALEAAAAGEVGEIAGEDLNGDGAIQSCVDGAIDSPHAAGAQRCFHHIRAKANAGHDRRSLGVHAYRLVALILYRTSAIDLRRGINDGPGRYQALRRRYDPRSAMHAVRDDCPRVVSGVS